MPLRSIECLRLAVHMCPHVHKDVGLVGLANVMKVLGRLEDALKAGQAALDINFDEVRVLSGCTYVYDCRG